MNVLHMQKSVSLLHLLTDAGWSLYLTLVITSVTFQL